LFDGDKKVFDKWIIKLSDKCNKNEKTFKKERNKIALIFNLITG